MACEAYRHSMEYLKSYMQRQWSLVGGRADVQGDGIGTTQKVTACYFDDDSLYCQRR